MLVKAFKVKVLHTHLWTMYGSKKMSTLTPRGGEGGGRREEAGLGMFPKAKVLKRKYRVKLEVPEGWGGVSMDIFWNGNAITGSNFLGILMSNHFFNPQPSTLSKHALCCVLLPLASKREYFMIKHGLSRYQKLHDLSSNV